jgi:predicted transglutaminase-like cysteine proteinase
MFKLLLAASMVLVSVPATPQTLNQPPVDTIARAKWPHANHKEIDALAYINRTINEAIVSESDWEHYGVEDMWVMAPVDGKGDCEDYALTKLYVLQRANFPIVSNTKIVGVVVHSKGGATEGHAILAVRLENGDVVYLDNMKDEPATRAELVRAGYQFFDWRA